MTLPTVPALRVCSLSGHPYLLPPGDVLGWTESDVVGWSFIYLADKRGRREILVRASVEQLDAAWKGLATAPKGGQIPGN